MKVIFNVCTELLYVIMLETTGILIERIQIYLLYNQRVYENIVYINDYIIVDNVYIVYM